MERAAGGHGERWVAAYRRDTSVFDRLSRAEDPQDAVFGRMAELIVPPEGRVLELGAGTGRATRSLAPSARAYVAVEPLAAMGALAVRDLPPSARWLRARGEALPFAPRSFDAAVATWLLADLRPPILGGVLREAERVLRPGGRGLWALENGWSGEFQELRGQDGEPGRRALAPLFAAGFELVEEFASELRFAGAEECLHVLATLLGPRAIAALRAEPRSRLGMDLVLLHRPVQRGG